MCDYSLEMYSSRPAREGERYVMTRFPSGSMGLSAPGQPSTAICLACDTALALRGLPADLMTRHSFAEDEKAVFIRLDSGVYRDGLRFANGVELSLQQIPAGVTLELVPAEPVKLPIGEDAEEQAAPERIPEYV